MKNRVLPSLAASILLIGASAGFAAPKSVPVAIRSVPNAQGRHISLGGKGGLFLGSTVIDSKQIFNLIDLNGAAIQDGDTVQIQFMSNKPTYWQENGATINRTGDKPGPKCQFKVKWKIKNKTLQFRAPSGKFVSASQKGQDIMTTAKASDPATVFLLVKNPVKFERPAPAKKPAAKPAKKKA